MKPSPSPVAWPPFERYSDWESQAGFARWSWGAAIAEAFLAGCASNESIAARTLERFADLVEFARAHSPLYRDLYRGVPAGAASPAEVPVTTRKTLMARFDDWVTDREVTKSSVQSFMADPRRIGHAYLGCYAVWKSSGTTGDPGLFVHDAAALAAYARVPRKRCGLEERGRRAARLPRYAGTLEHRNRARRRACDAESGERKAPARSRAGATPDQR